MNLQKSFILVLGKFPIGEIEQAFALYMATHTAMPKPADIMKIIRPPIEARKWCTTTFIDIKRRSREGQFITAKEREYCSDFVLAKIIASEEQRLLIEDTIKQEEQQDRQYWLEK